MTQEASPMTRPVSWLERLDAMRAEDAAHKGDPWKLRLERVRGKIDFADKLERVTTQQLFDVLEVPRRARTAGACRRLAAVMAELQWTPTVVCGRGLTLGQRDQVRGYFRDPAPVKPGIDRTLASI